MLVPNGVHYRGVPLQSSSIMQTPTFFFLADGCAGGRGTPSMGLDLASENVVRRYCGSLHGTRVMYIVVRWSSQHNSKH